MARIGWERYLEIKNQLRYTGSRKTTVQVCEPIGTRLVTEQIPEIGEFGRIVFVWTRHGWFLDKLINVEIVDD